jgi:hypothetical protein
VRADLCGSQVGKGALSVVMPERDQGIHRTSIEHFRRKMDGRVKPGHDDETDTASLRGAAATKQSRFSQDVIPGLVLTRHPGMTKPRLDCFASLAMTVTETADCWRG